MTKNAFPKILGVILLLLVVFKLIGGDTRLQLVFGDLLVGSQITAIRLADVFAYVVLLLIGFLPAIVYFGVVSPLQSRQLAALRAEREQIEIKRLHHHRAYVAYQTDIEKLQKELDEVLQQQDFERSRQVA